MIASFLLVQILNSQVRAPCCPFTNYHLFIICARGNRFALIICILVPHTGKEYLPKLTAYGCRIKKRLANKTKSFRQSKNLEPLI